MFAVSRKPISNPGKFVIKNDSRDTKDKNEESSVLSQKDLSRCETNMISRTSTNSGKSEVNSLLCENPANKETKRIKIKLSIVKDVPYSQKASSLIGESNNEKKMLKRSKEMKIKQKRVNREGNFNCGRWQPDEHQRFIEAIMKFGNEWKSVQKHVGTRSSTQARSHAQKFFVKIKKTNLLDLNMDLSKNSIKTLHEIANTMNSEEYFKAIKTLNYLAFERKNNSKRKNKKEESIYDLSDVISENQNIININEDIFSLNTNENTLFNSAKNSDMNYIENHINYKSRDNPKYLSHLNTSSQLFNNTTFNHNSNYSVKIIQNDKNSENYSKKNKEKSSVNTIIINNHINNYNYNVSIKNPYINTQDRSTNRKRNRLNSYEKNALINLFPDIRRECANVYGHHRKSCDETDLMEYFNCTFNNSKNDFDDEKEFLFLSPNEENFPNLHKGMQGGLQNKSVQNEHIFEDLIDFKPDLKSEKKNKFKMFDEDEIKIEPIFFN